MKSISIAPILALAYVANVTEPPESRAEERPIVNLATNHIAQVGAIVDDEEPAENPSLKLAVGLQTASLTGSSLQTGTPQPSPGFGYSTRGLTPTGEWRRMFKRKEQR